VGHRENVDVLCFSHLRWNSVQQRPHHLMKRCSLEHRVFFWEEAAFGDVEAPQLQVFRHTQQGYTRIESRDADQDHGLFIVTPALPYAMASTDFSEPLRSLLDEFLKQFKVEQPLAWYYAPMAVGFTEKLEPAAVVYDCMDELSAFRGAPQQMVERELRLLKMADVVFAGGRSLYESKKRFHDNIHLFPSSIDFDHFVKARDPQPQPPDQESIARSRAGFSGVAGFYGVIDERFDFELIADTAALLPQVQFVLLGPIIKVSESDLPRANNIHYLGQKSYSDLPGYLAGWDVALIPFARNESTRYISPTKTPEYLAAARPVVSTPIADVIASYGSVVRIAETPEDFANAIKAAIADGINEDWVRRADAAIAGQSWDSTWEAMWNLAGPFALSKAVH
jgi:Glycosyl transferases group 1